MAFILQESGSNQLSPSVSFSPALGGGDAVTVGGGVGGGRKESAPFDIEGGSVVRCELVFGRLTLTCDSVELDALGPGVDPRGVIYASVSHAGSDAPALTVKHGTSLPENGIDVTNRALYRAAPAAVGDGHKWLDVRRAVTVVAMSA